MRARVLSVAARRCPRRYGRGIGGLTPFRILFYNPYIQIIWWAASSQYPAPAPIKSTAPSMTWGIVQAIAPAWITTVDFVVLVVAEVYAAVLAALLLAFGGVAGVRDRLGFRFTSGRALLQALGLDVVALVVAMLFYVLFTPIF